MVKVILSYPEARTVSDKIIDGWYADAEFNDGIEIDEDASLLDKIAVLEDLGHITVSRIRSNNSDWLFGS